ncbi:25S rRNA (adenine645-N1)-methyltransferase [Aspergillus saccharolyticus JOP 1030-1]|uniref:Ribosomal RNA-processing protein 8 n=1 Tax=Aspergillus saccharolyticus JOP 1030-1 TaxID=1450539 RepID=A0A318ZT78_9EURO|nr:hypothetical protein BP01DRAFT_352441 [Aspergillus saccharolyticus JOP 1030-1]PYH49905.1 hypothetical protein BP01DRAFT_352441 [Aspergillus saccharolyticus JOP 1030-1]
MFAVPGWSLENSALKQQSEPVAQEKSNDKPSKPNGKDRKRKRDDNVHKGNVDAMYRRHIEGEKMTPWARKKAEKNAMKAEKNQSQDQAPKQENVETDAPRQSTDAAAEESEKPKSKKQKKNKNKNKEEKQEQSQDDAASKPSTAESMPVAPPETKAILTPLQQAMRQKLISSRFRHLNETLYTTPSSKALELFTSNPELFDEYHAGFARQVKESWPSNPVDGYIKALRARGSAHAPKRGKPDNKGRNSAAPLPRRPNGLCTVADLGCGDAQLARALSPSSKKLNLKLLSYDLHAPEGSPITKADISNLPLPDGSVDVAVFCLSLMGTNWVSFVEEAWRVLRSDGKGELWVSEVKSRFGKVTRKKAQIGAKKPLSKAEQKKLKKKQAADDADSDVEDNEIYAEDARPAANDDETDISAFVEVFRTRGFVLKQESVDKSNKMFVKMEFVKAGGAPTKGKHASSTPSAGTGPGKKRFIDRSSLNEKGMSASEEAAVLKPCVYKIR